jgi:CDP-diacylglycerol--serine O-phosphatidyltransferase
MLNTQRRLTRSVKRKELARRSIYILPNIFTTASMLGGFFAIVMALQGNYIYACMAVLGSLICDGLDGKVARATNTVSRFGIEYDSLADLVAFGVAPAVCIYLWGLMDYGRLGWLGAFLFVACGAMRLARFNVQVEKVGTSHFVGLPIPAAASMVMAVIALAYRLGFNGPVQFLPVLIMVFALSFLMVSGIPYMSFKELRLSRLKSFNVLAGTLIFFGLAAFEPCIMAFALIAGYVLLGPLGARLFLRGKARRMAESQAHEMKSAAATELPPAAGEPEKTE